MDETKEDFCPACIVGPLALAGAGASAVGSTKGGHKKMKKYMLWGGLATVLLSVLLFIYFMFIRDCNSCSQK